MQFHIDISSAVAFYGAIVATATGIVQIINFRRDRPRVKITVTSNADFHVHSEEGDDPYTTVTVANAGRRPVTITGVSCRKLYPKKGYVVCNCNPLPQELTEGKQLTAYVDEMQFDVCELEGWEVYDAVGHTYRRPVAPLYKRLISRFRRKLEIRRKKKFKQQFTDQ
jgi:hypothetical protein